jgi:uncharacterized membrane protein YbhN (UPF0104 family)
MRKVAVRAVQFVVVAVVVRWLVVPQLAASRGSYHLLLDIDSPWIAVATCAELGSLAGFALATRAMLTRATRPAAHRVLRIDLSTIALSHCLPGGGAAGTALGTRLLTRAGVPAADAWFTKLVQGIGSAVVLQGLLVASLATRLLVSQPSKWEVLLIAVETAGFIGVLAVGALARTTYVRDRVPGIVRQLGRPLTALRRDPRRIATAASWAAINWMFDAGALWAALRAYGHPVPVDSVLLAFALANTVAWLPISPSGLGISDAVMIPALIAFGSTHSAAVLGVITWRALGLVSYGTLHVESRRRRDGRGGALNVEVVSATAGPGALSL